MTEVDGRHLTRAVWSRQPAWPLYGSMGDYPNREMLTGRDHTRRHRLRCRWPTRRREG
jgi:hypothetical protein